MPNQPLEMKLLNNPTFRRETAVNILWPIAVINTLADVFEDEEGILDPETGKLNKPKFDALTIDKAKNGMEGYDSLTAKKQVERLLVLDEIGRNLIEVLEHALEVAKNGTIAQDL